MPSIYSQPSPLLIFIRRWKNGERGNEGREDGWRPVRDGWKVCWMGWFVGGRMIVIEHSI